MISSLMSRMAQAQNLDVNQLKQAVQDGTLPAYVGVPLIQDKMKQQQMAQAGKPQPAQPPIADQILAQADQKGIDSAPSNLQSMSGGGIAYAAGGDIDEDYEDQQQAMQDQQDQDYATMLMNQSEEPTEAHEPAYVNKTPNVEKGIKPPSIDALLSHIVRKESGGRNYNDNGKPLTSSAGAKFAMQVMPSTASDPGFGIQPAKDVTPEEYNRVGKELATALLNKYQNPVHAAAAYNWGSKNVDKWLAQGADPSRLPKETRGYIQGMNMAEGGIVSLAAGGMAHYDGTDGSLVQAPPQAAQGNALLAAYDATNPTTPDAANFGVTDTRSWDQSKTRGTPISLMDAIGRHLPSQTDIASGINSILPSTISQRNVAARQNSAAAATQYPIENGPEYNGPQLGVKPIAPATPAVSSSTPSVTPNTSTVAPEGITQLTTPSITQENVAPIVEKPKSALDLYLDKLSQSREELKNQKSEDKYMALMAAGLGILKSSGEIAPGKVHTALGDIASGGLEGIAYLQQAAKQRAAQEAALNKEENSAFYHNQINQTAAENAASNRALKEKELALKTEKFDPKEIANNKYSAAISRHPQIAEQNRLMTEEAKQGLLTQERYDQYQANIQKIQQAVAKQYGVDPDVAVKLKPIMDPIKPVQPSYFDRLKAIVSGSSPTNPVVTPDRQALLDKYNQ
jgi:hypothetical protein